MSISKKEEKSILATVELEGFEYTFIHFSDFPDIKDKTFQRAREAYVKAHKDLANIVGYKE